MPRLAHESDLPLPRLLSERQILSALGVSRSTLRRMRLSRTFPEPVRLSRSRVAWPLPVVEAWLSSRPATRDGMA